MTVSTIATLANGLSRIQQNQAPTRASAVLGSLLDAAPKNAADEVAKLTPAQTQQNQTAQFRAASQNIAQASALLSTAQAGISEITRELNRMGELAAKAAAPETTDSARAELNTQFQAGRSAIDTVVRTTQFNGEPLLDGNARQLKLQNDAGQVLSVEPLTGDKIFPAPKIDILGPSGATISLEAVRIAGQYVAAQADKVSKLQSAVEFAASSVEVAVENQDAARSSLSADEIGSLFAANPAPANASIASSAAQTNRLPSNLLALLNE